MSDLSVYVSFPAKGFHIRLLQEIDLEMDAIKFARAWTAWQLEGLGNLAVYEGRSHLSLDLFTSDLKRALVKFPGVELRVEESE